MPIDEGGSTGTPLIHRAFVPHAQIFSAAAVILGVYFGVLKCCYGSYSLTTVVREYKERRKLEEVSESGSGSIGWTSNAVYSIDSVARSGRLALTAFDRHLGAFD